MNHNRRGLGGKGSHPPARWRNGFSRLVGDPATAMWYSRISTTPLLPDSRDPQTLPDSFPVDSADCFLLLRLVHSSSSNTVSCTRSKK